MMKEWLIKKFKTTDKFEHKFYNKQDAYNYLEKLKNIQMSFGFGFEEYEDCIIVKVYKTRGTWVYLK